MTSELKKEIRKWLHDFNKTQPANVEVDYDTFEGSAYLLFQRVLAEAQNHEKVQT